MSILSILAGDDSELLGRAGFLRRVAHANAQSARGVVKVTKGYMRAADQVNRALNSEAELLGRAGFLRRVAHANAQSARGVVKVTRAYMDATDRANKALHSDSDPDTFLGANGVEAELLGKFSISKAVKTTARVAKKSTVAVIKAPVKTAVAVLKAPIVVARAVPKGPAAVGKALIHANANVARAAIKAPINLAKLAVAAPSLVAAATAQAVVHPLKSAGDTAKFIARNPIASTAVLGPAALAIALSQKKGRSNLLGKKSVAGKVAAFAARHPTATMIATGGTGAAVLATTKKGRKGLLDFTGNAAVASMALPTGGLSLLGKKSVRNFAKRHPYIAAAVNPLSLAYTGVTKQGQSNLVEPIQDAGHVVAETARAISSGVSSPSSSSSASSDPTSDEPAEPADDVPEKKKSSFLPLAAAIGALFLI